MLWTMRAVNEFRDWRGIRAALCLSQHQMASLLAMTDNGYWRLERLARQAHPSAVLILRSRLLDEPELQERLRRANYQYPWAEDLTSAQLPR